MNRRERRHKESIDRREARKFARSQAKIKERPHITFTAEQWKRSQQAYTCQVEIPGKPLWIGEDI